MTRRPRALSRSGAVTVETALVLPALVLLVLGMIVGGLGVFRYQLVAGMAREAARYAAVRGGDRQQETGTPAPTAQGIAQAAVAPLAVSMDPAALAVRVHWVNGVTGAVADWDASSKAPTTQNAAGEYVANRVRVTVTYRWVPEFFFTDPIELQGVTESPLSY